MPRPKAIEPSERVYFHLPSALHTKIKLALFSEVEGRVPYGAWADLLIPLLNEKFSHRYLDLGPFLGKPAGTFVVKGDPTVLAMLENHLKELQNARTIP